MNPPLSSSSSPLALAPAASLLPAASAARAHRYAQGMRAGIAARGMAGPSDLTDFLESTIAQADAGGVGNRSDPWVDEDGGAAHGSDTRPGNDGAPERTFDLPAALARCAAEDRAPDADESANFAARGLRYLGPDHDGFAIRLEPPGGRLEPCVLRVLADLCQRYGNGSVVLCGACGGIELRIVSVREAPAAWREISAAGLCAGNAASEAESESGASGIELRVADDRLLSSQMLELAASLEEHRANADALRLTPTGGLILLGCDGRAPLAQRLRVIMFSAN